LEESCRAILSSPIILYDFPKLNPNSPGDLFDSTEIEEALLLHLAAMPEEEKQRLAQSDEKLGAMINKMSQVTPQELMNLHGGMKENEIKNNHLIIIK
jgi:hydrogenase maturation protease